jgi:hypothetical protein
MQPESIAASAAAGITLENIENLIVMVMAPAPFDRDL